MRNNMSFKPRHPDSRISAPNNGCFAYSIPPCNSPEERIQWSSLGVGGHPTLIGLPFDGRGLQWGLQKGNWTESPKSSTVVNKKMFIFSKPSKSWDSTAIEYQRSLKFVKQRGFSCTWLFSQRELHMWMGVFLFLEFSRDEDLKFPTWQFSQVLGFWEFFSLGPT